MVIENIGPEWEYWTYDRFVANGYEVSLHLTIFGGTRVYIRKANELSYLINWCCGKGIGDVNKLLNVAFEVIDRGMDIEKLPTTEIHPWYNDPDFCLWVEGFNKQYVDITAFLHMQIAAFALYKNTGRIDLIAVVDTIRESHVFIS